jgi:alcohol dehydrogenase (cytochrome c)
MKKRPRRIGLLLALLIIGATATVLLVPQSRWRVQVIVLHLAGKLPDIELLEVVQFMLPSSDQSMAFLIEQRNPYAVVRNKRTSAPDIEAGGALYQTHCIGCHGAGAAGSHVGPALVGRPLTHGDSDWAIYRTIRLGLPNTAMQSVRMTPTERWQLISYVRSLDKPGTQAASIAAPQRAYEAVTFEDLVHAEQRPQDWLTFSGSYSSVRHSALAQVDRTNVGQLTTKWLRQIEGTGASIEVSPLVHNGIMYLALAPCVVLALDAKTGETLWTYVCTLNNDEPSEFTVVSYRGVALLDDKIFFATWDMQLIAISATTGQEIWHTTVDEDDYVYHVDSAPLAFGDQVAVGVASRLGGRGHLVVFDAATGKERWRFNAIPGPGEPGNETWEGDSWKIGGGSMWLSGSYDPATDLLYWPVGNPKPDYKVSERLGDNLYTDSMVALRGSTGELVWHFQATPGDNRDWDASQMPTLVDLPMQGGTRKALLWANRNGFYYVLDRITGELLVGTPFAEQNWAEGLDEKGRPIRKPLSGGLQGDLVYPGNVGATNWWPPTYDPKRQLMIVPVLEQGQVFFSSFNSPPLDTGKPFYTAVRALDASTGKLVWESRHAPRLLDNGTSGLLSTDGGLVFGGDLAEFSAYDIDSGEVLWSLETGGRIIAAPMTYAVDGEQMIALVAGRVLFVFGLPKAHPNFDPSSSAAGSGGL